MDEQLTWLSTLFDDHDIRYWVESGTLLTLYRSGRLTKYDDDIDLAVWASDLESVDSLLPVIKRRGYDVQIRTYHGHRYKYQFIPTSQRTKSEAVEQRLIDVMVFRRSNGHAWTAQSRLTTDLSVSGFSRALELVAPLIERYARSTPGRIEMASFPHRLVTDILTLWLPLRFVGSRQYNPDLGVYTPADIDSYLTFRYGDWRTPVEDWSLTDDRAIVVRDPRAHLEEQNLEGEPRFRAGEPGPAFNEPVAHDS